MEKVNNIWFLQFFMPLVKLASVLFTTSLLVLVIQNM